ncbi:MAG: gluconate 2-dehydrogenase subunit 3 family protein [Gemmatimonadaceae bacterium]|nr:gluconate 2-dehydrogenase subunit 3 family protein [Gemmatimonadaceae bacterium]
MSDSEWHGNEGEPADPQSGPAELVNIANTRSGERPGIGRREAVSILAMLPIAAAFGWSPDQADHAARRAAEALNALDVNGETYAPKFFTPHEWRTVRILVDLIIPRDARSGSATDAGVPAFMDFILMEFPSNQKRMREALAWMDAECQRRFTKTFAACTPVERTALLEDIAWPERATPAMKDGVSFFNYLRDFTASGFWSSQMGVRDLRYIGNVAVAKWDGCPPAALRKLGVSYDT